MSLNRVGKVLAVFVVALGCAVQAHAQIGSSIAGVVKDASGGVLPGVTVDALEPVAHRGLPDRGHRRRRPVQDRRSSAGPVHRHLHADRIPHREARGHHVARLVHRDGERRDGGRHASGSDHGHQRRAAGRRAQLGSESAINRETLDAIPTGKDPFAVAQLIAGITTATPDVGGTQLMQQPTLQVHGSSNNDNVFMVDGVQIEPSASAATRRASTSTTA